jgi:predicted ATPase
MRREDLPFTTGEFVGREDELRALGTLAVPGRVVTLVGPGGIGKTRLALAFLERHIEAGLASRAWFCDLAAARDEIGVCAGVARALGLRVEAHASLAEQVGRALAAAGPGGLLLLDNLEQVASPLDATLGRWCAQAPAVRFLATSRRPVEIEGEALLEVGPLPLPPPGEESAAVLERSAAVRLFFDRASRRSRRELSMERDGATVASLVRRLDGIALAIELAAGRLDVLPLDAIERRLGERFQLLRDPTTMGSHRHSTLWATVAWSWDLLSDAHRSLLAQATVFEGAFDEAAAEGVLELPSADDAGDVRDAIHALARQSLVRRLSPSEGGAEHGAGFALYETVREFAVEHLTEVERRGVQLRHARFFVRRGTAAAVAYEARGGLADLRELERAHDDMMAALRRALIADPPAPEAARWAAALVLAVGHVMVWRWQSQLHLELVDAARSALSRAGAADDPEGALLSIGLAYGRGFVLGRLGHLDEALREIQEWLAVARHRGARVLEGTLAKAESYIHATAGNIKASRESADRAIELLASGGAERHLGAALLLRSMADVESDRFVEARSGFSRARAVFAAIGNRLEEAAVLGYLGVMAFKGGDLDESHALLEEAHAAFVMLGHRRSETQVSALLAKIAHVRGRWDEAARIYEEVGAAFEQRGERIEAAEVGVNAGVVALHARRLDDAESQLRRAMGVLDRGSVPYEMGAAALAGVRALRGDLAGAELTLAEIEGRVGPVGASAAAGARFAPIVDVYRGVIEVLRGDVAAARRRQARLAVVRLAEVRVALPLLQSVIEEAERRARTWTFEARGAAFRAPGGERVELAAHDPLARIVAALASHRLERPGDVLAKETLVRAGWPEEARLQMGPGANRLRVAVSKLRAAGLGPLIVSAPGGYMLDPAVPVQVDGFEFTGRPSR